MKKSEMYYFEQEDILHLVIAEEEEANGVDVIQAGTIHSRTRAAIGSWPYLVTSGASSRIRAYS